MRVGAAELQPPPALPLQALRMPLAGDAKVVYSEAPRFWGLLRPREYVT